MKLLYLTFLEPVVHNGIYDTQVKQLLCKLADEHSRAISISHIVLLPAAEVGRKELIVPFISQKQELAALLEEYGQHGIRARVLYIPVILPKRWTSGTPLPLLVLVLALASPLFLWNVARQRPDIIHCRSYPATILALFMKALFRNLKVVFDPRGFWPEEGVVTRRWKQDSLMFRFWKRVEQWMFRGSDRVVALSEAFAEHVREVAKEAECAVIYASADFEKLQQAVECREQKRLELGLNGKQVLVYNGSLHAWHDPVLLARLYDAIRCVLGNTKLLVLTAHSKEKLEEAFRGAGLSSADFAIVAARADEVPGYLAAADFGLVPLKELDQAGAMGLVARTMIGTKVAEYLACGLPIIVNQNVGGLKSLMARHKIGIFFDAENLPEIPRALQPMLQDYRHFQDNCVLVAARYFALGETARSYYRLYQEMLFGPGSKNREFEIVNAS